MQSNHAISCDDELRAANQATIDVVKLREGSLIDGVRILDHVSDECCLRIVGVGTNPGVGVG